MPGTKDGREWRHDLDEVLAWCMRQGLTVGTDAEVAPASKATKRGGRQATALTAARTRRELANAEAAEIDLAKKRRQVIDRATTQAAFASLMRELVSRFLAIPVDVAPRVVVEDDLATCERLIRQPIYDALRTIAKGDEVIESVVREVFE